MRKATHLTHGIGVRGLEYPTKIGDVHIKEHTLWSSMLCRCTEKYWLKDPQYTGTTCSENFKSYAFFYEWCNRQIGFGNKDEAGHHWQLDKDLLGNGLKSYSEDTCVFVPRVINCLLNKQGNNRGAYPIGVTFHKETQKFVAQCRNKNGRTFIGRFNTVEDAFAAYKTTKESVIRSIAEEYKTQIDSRVYSFLLNYTLKDTD